MYRKKNDKMNLAEFKELSNHRILPVTIEIDRQVHPKIPAKLPSLFDLNFKESAVKIIELDLLSQRKKEEVDSISYTDIEKIEVNPIKKLTVVVFAPGTRINLDLLIFLTNGERLHFECEEMSVVATLSTLMKQHNVEVIDSFQLADTFTQADSIEEAYEHLDKMIEKAQQELLRVTQVEES